jgi:hypothetical protein
VWPWQPELSGEELHYMTHPFTKAQKTYKPMQNKLEALRMLGVKLLKGYHQSTTKFDKILFLLLLSTTEFKEGI